MFLFLQRTSWDALPVKSRLDTSVLSSEADHLIRRSESELFDLKNRECI